VRCMMLPPIDAMLRSWPDAANISASAMSGNCLRTSTFAATSLMRANAPILRPPPGVASMRAMSASPLMSSRRLGSVARSLIRPSRSVPPVMKGAARFGWNKRTPEPRSMRDGRYLIGQGVAAAVYTHWRWPAKARVTLNRDGSALVEAGMHEIGGGTYTVMRQVAADALGVRAEMVTVKLGDTRLPASHASIGSATMANAGASVMLAANAVRDKAVGLALTGQDAPFLGAADEEVLIGDGTLAPARKNLHITYAELLARNGLSTLVAAADYDPVEEAKGPKAIFSFGAVFAEVRVDPDLGLVRLSRVVGAYDAGRIINPKTARSQAIGGIIWDEEASPLGVKGLGELTAVPVAPAIANAVYHATGRRVRDLPITIEKLL
jgi:xanthine dehydrogenase YagR molybdenum-binding subunit